MILFDLFQVHGFFWLLLCGYIIDDEASDCCFRNTCALKRGKCSATAEFANACDVAHRHSCKCGVLLEPRRQAVLGSFLASVQAHMPTASQTRGGLMCEIGLEML